MKSVDCFLAGISKGTFLSLLFVLVTFYGYSQSCNCPPVASCGPCQGGMTRLTFKFHDSRILPVLPATVTVTDGNGTVIGGGAFSDGDSFEVTAAVEGDLFGGNQITISILLGASETITTSCVTPIFVGDRFGDFEVTAGKSMGNTSICCAVEDMETVKPNIVCPSNTTTSLSAGQCTKSVTWSEPIATDNCGTPTVISTHASGFSFPRGTTIVTYTATDRYNNTKSCSFNVTVNDLIDPQISGCPSNITVNADATAGTCGTNVTWTPPTASDNCATGLMLTTTKAPGSFFAVGTTPVTYTATDAAGRTATCTFNVVVNDVTNPIITSCPSTININASASAGVCGTNVTWTPPTVTDNCSVNMTSDRSPGQFFPVGTTSVTYTATDASGRTATCSFNVVVTDATNPVITGCPTTITVNADATAGVCGTNVTWTPPTTTDNCVVNMTSNKTPGQFFAVGTTPVTYTATDASGRQSTCTFNVVVNDVTNPVITGCPSPITVNAVATAGVCGTNVMWTPPTVVDNCVVNMTSSKTPGQFFAVGTTVVTYTATDASGRQSTCSFNVIVNDVTSPVITGCPSTITVNADATAGTCGANVTWTPPTATDNCAVNLTSNKTPGQFFTVGTTTVTYTATDASGRTATCTFDVVVNDATNPVITGCPSTVTVNALTTAGTCGANVTWTAPTVSDNCVVNMTSSKAPGSFFAVGTTPVTYTATDASGRQSTCTFNVVVNDVTNPVITGCPSSITVDADATAGSCGTIVNWTPPTAADNCVVNMTSNKTPGQFFAVGTTVVTYTATDASGRQSTCSFNVVVNDVTNPIISGCPSTITVNANSAAGSCGTNVTWSPPTVTDNCVVNMTSNKTPGQFFAVGTTVVTYTATDASGRQSTCSFDVIVKDVTNPVITGCPSTITINADVTASTCGANVTWTPPTAADNCTVTITSNKTPTDFFAVGTTVVTYTATDASGNIATCEFNVVVIDQTNPTLTNCPANITVGATANCNAVVTWTAPIASDNCQVALTSSHPSGSTFPLGTTVVTYTATDPSGNKTSCSFNVTVVDESAPVFASCPSTIKVNAGSSCKGLANWTTPTFTDCSNVTLVSTHQSGAEFPIGSTVVMYTATDLNGKSSTCSFMVTVEDKSNPVFTSCPPNITVDATASCNAIVSWTAPVATDNCGVPSLTSSHQSGDTFPIGVTVVSYTATDLAGNSSKCEFNVVVRNKNLPVITNCPSDQLVKVIDTDSGTASWDAPVATVECGSVTMTSNFAPGSSFPVGETIVEYKATDEAGNVSTCSFIVKVTYEDLEFTISQLVTPDGDGINDEWTLANIEKFKDNRVTVFDRWGSIVYAASGYDNQSTVWRGTNSSGGAVPTGTYFFTITVKYREDYVEKKGFIEVVR